MHVPVLPFLWGVGVSVLAISLILNLGLLLVLLWAVVVSCGSLELIECISRGGCSFVGWLSWFCVVKFLRAHGGCLGIRSRRRT